MKPSAGGRHAPNAPPLPADWTPLWEDDNGWNRPPGGDAGQYYPRGHPRSGTLRPARPAPDLPPLATHNPDNGPPECLDSLGRPIPWMGPPDSNPDHPDNINRHRPTPQPEPPMSDLSDLSDEPAPEPLPVPGPLDRWAHWNPPPHEWSPEPLPEPEPEPEPVWAHWSPQPLPPEPEPDNMPADAPQPPPTGPPPHEPTPNTETAETGPDRPQTGQQAHRTRPAVRIFSTAAEHGADQQTRPTRQPPTLQQARQAVSGYCGLPTDQPFLDRLPLKPEWWNHRPAVAFCYPHDQQQADDRHIRYLQPTRNSGLVLSKDWAGWNLGATGKRLYPILPPEGINSVQAVLLVEGETSGITAAWHLQNTGWAVLATTGANYQPATDRDRQRIHIIRQRNLPVVIWPDNDNKGHQMGTRLQTLPEAFADHPTIKAPTDRIPAREDLRWWLTNQTLRHGYDHTTRTLLELLNELLTRTRRRKPAAPKPAPASASASAVSGLPAKPTHRKRRSNRPPNQQSEYTRTQAQQHLHQQNPLTQVLQTLGATHRHGTTWSCFNTHHHNSGDQNPSLSVFNTPDGTGGYRCHACDISGDIITAHALAYHNGDNRQTLRTAYQQLRDQERPTQ